MPKRGWRHRGVWPWLCLGLVLAAGCGGNPRGRQASPEVTTIPARQALIVSGKGTRVYHYCGCAYAQDIPEKELLGFRSPKDAEQTGRIACAVCQPRTRFVEYQHELTPAGEAPRSTSTGQP